MKFVKQKVSFILKVTLQSLNQANSCQKDQNLYWLGTNELWNVWQSVYKSEIGMTIYQQIAEIEPFCFYYYSVFQGTLSKVKNVYIGIQMRLGHCTICIRAL